MGDSPDVGLRRELCWLIEDARRREASLTWEKIGELTGAGGGEGAQRRSAARSYLHQGQDRQMEEAPARRLAALAGYEVALIPAELVEEVRALEAAWRAAKGYPPRDQPAAPGALGSSDKLATKRSRSRSKP